MCLIAAKARSPSPFGVGAREMEDWLNRIAPVSNTSSWASELLRVGFIAVLAFVFPSISSTILRCFTSHADKSLDCRTGGSSSRGRPTVSMTRMRRDRPAALSGAAQF
jgi:hypothetical protein